MGGRPGRRRHSARAPDRLPGAGRRTRPARPGRSADDYSAAAYPSVVVGGRGHRARRRRGRTAGRAAPRSGRRRRWTGRTRRAHRRRVQVSAARSGPTGTHPARAGRRCGGPAPSGRAQATGRDPLLTAVAPRRGRVPSGAGGYLHADRAGRPATAVRGRPGRSGAAAGTGPPAWRDRQRRGPRRGHRRAAGPAGDTRRGGQPHRGGRPGIHAAFHHRRRPGQPGRADSRPRPGHRGRAATAASWSRGQCAAAARRPPNRRRPESRPRCGGPPGSDSSAAT